MVSENRVLWRIFGSKGDDVTGEWKNYVTKSLIICIPHPIVFGQLNREEYIWAGHVARMGEGRGVHRILVEKPEKPE
jgi:hypothetical protein